MTQEEKQLVLKDVCARLSYGTKFRFRLSDGSDRPIDFLRRGAIYFDELYSYWVLEGYIIPYLRPMSSMTDEEKFRFNHLDLLNYENDGFEMANYRQIDWLNDHHFDYRGLIEKGLALEAPEDLYKI